MSDRMKETIWSVVRILMRCKHERLAYYGRNEGVYCLSCHQRWRRVVTHVGRTRVSFLVKLRRIKGEPPDPL